MTKQVSDIVAFLMAVVELMALIQIVVLKAVQQSEKQQALSALEDKRTRR